MKNKHATFGSPSSLYRNKACPGNIAYTKDLPTPPTSEHAKEGTKFHKVMEETIPLFLEGKDGIDKILSKLNDSDMAACVVETLGMVQQKWNNFKTNHLASTYYTELRIKITDDIYGTSDVVFVGKSKKTKKWNVVAIDFKYGRGVPIKAENNLQGVAYLLGAINTLGIQNVGRGFLGLATQTYSTLSA